MVAQVSTYLRDLYEADETAWLDTMSELIREGKFGDLDYAHLSEYLADMARRDRRRVESRLTVLLVHILKWAHQPTKRSKSWRRTIIIQRQKLTRDVAEGVLRNHAKAVLSETYSDAVELACVETGLPPEAFPAECPYSLEELLSQQILDGK